MSIVAISETAGSLGNEIGRRLAETLGWSFADREIIAKAAERYGADIADIRHGVEEKPSLWERITDSQHRYQIFVEATVFDLASQDNVVLAGLASTLVLREVRHALRVRINASERERASRLLQQEGLTPEAALDVVRQSDRERAARVKFLYHVDVDDALLYDLVLNTDRMTVERGVKLLREALEDERFQPTEAARRDLADRNTMTQARALFLANPVLADAALSVFCRQGQVSVAGIVWSADARRTAEEALLSLPGVTAVTNEIAVAPARRGRPARDGW
jgi:cytidylate kinase